MFIVLEGVDGSGKSTQLDNIVNHIKSNYPNKKVIYTKEPGGYNNILGKQLRNIILTNEMDDYTRALLYAADRYEHQLLIKKWLEEDYIVICDRYIYSSFAYQLNDNLSIEDIMNINKHHNIIKPDYILFFKINLDTYKNRKNARSKKRELDVIEKRPDKFFFNTMINYGKALESEWSKIIEINANNDLIAVTNETLNAIDSILNK